MYIVGEIHLILKHYVNDGRLFSKFRRPNPDATREKNSERGRCPRRGFDEDHSEVEGEGRVGGALGVGE